MKFAFSSAGGHAPGQLWPGRWGWGSEECGSEKWGPEGRAAFGLWELWLGPAFWGFPGWGHAPSVRVRHFSFPRGALWGADLTAASKIPFCPTSRGCPRPATQWPLQEPFPFSHQAQGTRPARARTRGPAEKIRQSPPPGFPPTLCPPPRPVCRLSLASGCPRSELPAVGFWKGARPSVRLRPPAPSGGALRACCPFDL